MTARRILLVDDQREIARMLRASLEMLNRGYVIVDVPSGEEAVLEMNHARFDLLVADVRLPGISGLKLVERIQRTNPKARAILITGHPSPDLEAQASRLNAFAVLYKPLRTDAFLQCVQAALAESAADSTPALAPLEPAGLSDRLAVLRQDLGALAVFMLDLDGRVVVRAGDVTALPMDSVLPHLMSGFSAALKVTSALGGLVPSNIQFFHGGDFDIYAANVGVFFALVIVFEGGRGGGQMGPVLRYGRRAMDDLLNILSAMGVPHEPEAPRPVEPAPVAPPRPVPPAESLAGLEQAARQLAGQDPIAFWDQPPVELPGDLRPDGLTYEQAIRLGLIPGEFEE